MENPYINRIKYERYKDLLCKLVFSSNSDVAFFGEFGLYLDFIENRDISTCGVTVDWTGLKLFYNPEFLDSLTDEEFAFIFYHEIFHLIYRHTARTAKGDNRDIANIAQDMIINRILQDSNIPDIKMPESGLLPPEEYEGKLIYEELYEWLMKNSGKPQDFLGRLLDEHLENNCPADFQKMTVESIVDKLRERGKVSNNMEKLLGKLKKNNKDYLRELKFLVDQLKGGKIRMSLLRPNRKKIPGLKGKKRYGRSINCILDTSGSMGGEFEKVLSVIFQDNLHVNLVQCDTKVHRVSKIKNKTELQKIKILGLGGTELQPAIDYVVNDRELRKLNTLILTDGVTDSLDVSQLKGLIISCHRECPIKKGHIKQVILPIKN